MLLCVAPAAADAFYVVHTVNIVMKKGGLDFPVPYIEKCEAGGACIRACPFSDEFDEDGD